MTVNELKQILYEIVKEYFTEANIVWGKVGGVKMPEPLAVLTAGAVKRSNFAVNTTINGEIISYYPSEMILEVNYYPDAVTKENTATSELEDFLNYINSPYVTHQCDRADISINQTGAARDLTELEYDTSWHYRAMVELNVGFMQKAFGYKGGNKFADNATGYFKKVKIDNFKNEKRVKSIK